ncbi:hypothetical protein G9272_26105 [Streptomyces asoensis]|uniref:Lipoprotein n=1 Tax=Streptomyces asoensis TaxID=249586 RepID=A0A6M4WZA0_9ACTN|nr:hypothetical protein [Streptomyces asoensis]QJT03326.1 hypothetical protein G9272_26105 [Streptomyces asoensis]
MRNRLAIIAAAAVLPMTAAISLAAATQAGADPNSKTVVVTGAVEDCPNGTPPNKVTITTTKSKEVRTDKTDVDDTGEYSVKFTKIAKAGDNGTAKVTCTGDSYTDTFKIKRPTDPNSLTQEQDIESP